MTQLNSTLQMSLALSFFWTKSESESEVAQRCLTLCHPMDCSPPGSSVHRFSRQEYWSGLPFPSPLDTNDMFSFSFTMPWSDFLFYLLFYLVLALLFRKICVSMLINDLYKIPSSLFFRYYLLVFYFEQYGNYRSRFSSLPFSKFWILGTSFILLLIFVLFN